MKEWLRDLCFALIIFVGIGGSFLGAVLMVASFQTTLQNGLIFFFCGLITLVVFRNSMNKLLDKVSNIKIEEGTK